MVCHSKIIALGSAMLDQTDGWGNRNLLKFNSMSGYRSRLLVPPGLDEFRRTQCNPNTIGRGGQGAVYECRSDPKSPFFDLALKVPDKCTAEDDAEVKILQTLSRAQGEEQIVPGLKRVFRTSHDCSALLMQRAHAVTQESIARLPLKQKLRYFRQMAHNLHFMHEKGFVHVDYKIENSMAVNEGEDRDYLLIDFGFSHDMGTFGTADTKCRGGSYGLLAPECLPDPEGALPTEHSVSAKTDVFSLGAEMAWTLLSTENRSGLTNILPPSAQRDDILWRKGLLKVWSSSLHPIVVHIRKLAGGKHEKLFSLVEQMLNKDPAKRPEMREVENKLKALENRDTTLTNLKRKFGEESGLSRFIQLETEAHLYEQLCYSLRPFFGAPWLCGRYRQLKNLIRLQRELLEDETIERHAFVGPKDPMVQQTWKEPKSQSGHSWNSESEGMSQESDDSKEETSAESESVSDSSFASDEEEGSESSSFHVHI